MLVSFPYTHAHSGCSILYVSRHSHIIGACDQVSDARLKGLVLQNKYTKGSWCKCGAGRLSSLSELRALLCWQFSVIGNNCVGTKSNKGWSRAWLVLCVTQGVRCHYEWGNIFPGNTVRPWHHKHTKIYTFNFSQIITLFHHLFGFSFLIKGPLSHLHWNGYLPSRTV